MTEHSPSERRRSAVRVASRAAEEERRTVEELRSALHEVQAQRTEIEQQNDQLHQTQRRLESLAAELRASESRYRELFERAPVAYLRLDADGTIREANLTAAELLGLEKSQLEGRKLASFVAASHQDAFYRQRQAAALAEHPSPATLMVRASDGELRDVELGARPSEGEAGDLLVALLDVTARERAEADRHASERQRRLMADSLPVAVGYVAADGRFEFCNRAFERLLGRRAEEVEARAIFEVFDESTYSALRDHVRRALEGVAARTEGELRFAAAGLRFVSVLLAPDREPGGPVRGFYALIDDRSELEEARRGLRNAAAQAALAEERERRALAVDLHDDVGQLLSLGAMKLRALEDEGSGTASAKPLREVSDLMRQARERISSLSFELSPPLLYDVGLVAAAEWLAENLERRYGLRTTIERWGELPALDEAVRITLFRSLRELLINVAKHAGTARARVSIEGRADGVALVVEDRGRGFDPQLATGGFGLRSVRDRIESLGGELSIDSLPGHGARVSLTVPVGKGAP